MYPHERSLVARQADRPFVFLGINSDEDRDALQRARLKEGITWRSWADGSTSGPIAAAWHVQSWPTLYILDAHGVIRYERVNGPQLDRAVETLLRELEHEKRS
jgi:hypothetical protein